MSRRHFLSCLLAAWMASAPAFSSTDPSMFSRNDAAVPTAGASPAQVSLLAAGPSQSASMFTSSAQVQTTPSSTPNPAAAQGFLNQLNATGQGQSGADLIGIAAQLANGDPAQFAKALQMMGGVIHEMSAHGYSASQLEGAFQVAAQVAGTDVGKFGQAIGMMGQMMEAMAQHGYSPDTLLSAFQAAASVAGNDIEKFKAALVDTAQTIQIMAAHGILPSQLNDIFSASSRLAGNDTQKFGDALASTLKLSLGMLQMGVTPDQFKDILNSVSDVSHGDLKAYRGMLQWAFDGMKSQMALGENPSTYGSLFTAVAAYINSHNGTPEQFVTGMNAIFSELAAPLNRMGLPSSVLGDVIPKILQAAGDNPGQLEEFVHAAQAFLIQLAGTGQLTPPQNTQTPHIP